MPLTKVLLKIFAYRFYREHSGLLLFFFVTILNYCFFIKTAGVYRSEDSVFYHLMLMMSFINSPLVMLVVFAFFLVYTIKSWGFVAKQLLLDNNQFLFYSLTAHRKTGQFKSWFCVQLVIALPFIVYWLFATVLGVIYHANLVPAITFVYLLLTASVSSLLYVYLVNRIHRTAKSSFLIRMSRNWIKPYYSLFIYHLFDRLKMIYLLTKIFSLTVMTGILSLFSDQLNDGRIAAMIMLAAVTLHSFIIYKEHDFKETYLGFSRNLPFNRFKTFADFSLVYLFLLLPEMIWFFYQFPPLVTIEMLFFGLSIAYLFRSLVFLTSLKIYRYLLWIFCLFIFLFYMIISGQFWLLLILNMVVSFAVFYVRYYSVRTVIKF
jgi:hypothetical protein